MTLEGDWCLDDLEQSGYCHRISFQPEENDMNDSFKLFAPRWFGWQMNPGYVGERCVPYFSPIHVTRVAPLKTGQRNYRN
jgi:hypothetical protein